MYDDNFFDSVTDRSLASARQIVPIVLEIIQPDSVVDIGCGRGSFLKAFAENGVTTILGFDGDYVDRSKLLISPDDFRQIDLAKHFDDIGTFDLAVCLEVGEHLPDRASRLLVRQLTHAAPLVLFSAALPGQGGTHHINERFPTYWRSLFSSCGFVRLDPFRHRLWHMPQIDWWYKQNLYLFADESLCFSNSVLRREREMSKVASFELIHEHVMRSIEERYTVAGILRALASTVRKSLLRGSRAK